MNLLKRLSRSRAWRRANVWFSGGFLLLGLVLLVEAARTVHLFGLAYWSGYVVMMRWLLIRDLRALDKCIAQTG